MFAATSLCCLMFNLTHLKYNIPFLCTIAKCHVHYCQASHILSYTCVCETMYVMLFAFVSDGFQLLISAWLSALSRSFWIYFSSSRELSIPPSFVSPANLEKIPSSLSLKNVWRVPDHWLEHKLNQGLPGSPEERFLNGRAPPLKMRSSTIWERFCQCSACISCGLWVAIANLYFRRMWILLTSLISGT